MASAWLRPPIQQRVPGDSNLERRPPAEFVTVAAELRLGSASALPRATPFRPKAAEQQPAKPQLPFPAGSVPVLSAAKLHTHFSCLGTFGKTRIKRRVWVLPAFCQGKRALASARIVIAAAQAEALAKDYDGHQDTQNQHDNSQQIHVVRHPRFLHRSSVRQKGRDKFFRIRNGRDRQRIGRRRGRQ